MEGDIIANILAAHADALNRGENPTDHYLERYAAQANELASLFRLAEAIREAMPPAKPSDLFRESLSRRLGSFSSSTSPEDGPNDRGGARWRTVVAAGSLISVAGLTIYLMRRSRLDAGRTESATAPAI
jgi:hypothetical protein